MFVSTFSLMEFVHSAGGCNHVSSIFSKIALMQDCISPITGAAIGTLLSISFGSISICINFLSFSPQVLPFP